MEYIPLTFSPNLDSNWDVAPGACTDMNALAPMLYGAYGSMGYSTTPYVAMSAGGADILSSYAFRQINGTVRLLNFRTTNIDEYTSGAVRTNRATGLTTATEWNATAWGNQIIAVSKANATQSSTGAGFSALGGSSPKARHIASNLSFVMMADVDDSGSNVYQDMVWWCALQNPASWTPSIATQAGNQRLLDAPGPITALVAYQDKFIAFKDNAIFVGEYVGPQQFIFNWRMLSNRIGCVGAKAVVELDGKLYFLHPSGFYEFDGANIRNVGLPVFQRFLAEIGYIGTTAGTEVGFANTQIPLYLTKAAADDIDGIVWFISGYYNSGSTTYTPIMFGYNARTGKWGRWTAQIQSGSNTNPPILVFGATSDMQAFKADTTARVWMQTNELGANAIYSIAYPYTTNVSVTASFTTGILGQKTNASTAVRVYFRHIQGSDAFATNKPAGNVKVYKNEDMLTLQSTTALVVNTEFNALDGMSDSRFKTLDASYTQSKVILAGIALEAKASGRR